MKKLIYPLLTVFAVFCCPAYDDVGNAQDAEQIEQESHKAEYGFLHDLGADYFRPILALNSILTNNCISSISVLPLIHSLEHCSGFLEGRDDKILVGEYYDHLLNKFLVFDEDACFGDDCQDSCGAVEKIFDESAYERVPEARIQISDRISGIVKFFDLIVGDDDILAFKNLRVLVRSCFRSVPSERLETVAFLEIWEIDEVGKPEQIFKGWMFSKHSLNILEHPIYDVRIVD